MRLCIHSCWMILHSYIDCFLFLGLTVERQMGNIGRLRRGVTRNKDPWLNLGHCGYISHYTTRMPRDPFCDSSFWSAHWLSKCTHNISLSYEFMLISDIIFCDTILWLVQFIPQTVIVMQVFTNIVQLNMEALLLFITFISRAPRSCTELQAV